MIYQLHEPSKNGTSSWIQWLGCPRRARRGSETRALGFSSLGSPEQQVGTLGHAFLDLYHTRRCGEFGAADVDDIVFHSWGVGSERDNVWHTGEAIKDEVLAEARRVFKAYTQLRTWDYFGDENHAEVALGESEAERLAVTGMADADWSGRADLLCTRDSTTVVVDHKILGRSPSITSRLDYSMSLQLRGYMLAAAARGMNVSHGIVNVVLKTKEVRVETIEVPFPNRRERDEVHAFFKHVSKIKAERSDEVNINNCIDFWKVCPYLEDASCDRM